VKRSELIRHLKNYGCELLREGSRHSVWANVSDKRTSVVPRHNEIVDQLARKICKDLGVPWIREEP
jgi:mRNA interferase HicA